MHILASKVEYFNKPIQIFKRILWPFLSKQQDKEVMLPWRLPIKINPRQTIGKSIYTLGVYDIIVSEALSRLIKLGDHVIDVGANIGYMTNLMAIKSGNTGNVDSFEPHPTLIDSYLIHNLNLLQRSGISNIKFYPKALSNFDGIGNLYIPSDFLTNDGISSLENDEKTIDIIPVHVSRLDSLLQPTKLIRLMKVDVEGHELAVFQGASSLLDSGIIENIIYEEHIGIDSDASIYLSSKGYSIFKLNRSNKGPRLSQPDDASHDLPYEAINFLATKNPNYVKQQFIQKGWTIYKLGRNE